MPVAGADQAILTSQTSKVFDCEVPGRRKAVQASQGQTAEIPWQFTTPEGLPVDLTSCGTFAAGDPTTGSVRLRTREAVILPGCPNPVIDVVGTVTSVAGGQASFPLGADATAKAGIYLAEAAVFNPVGGMVFSNQLYLVVNRSLFALDQTEDCGIPSIAEIRLSLRDSDGRDNPLLETVQFDLAEIAAAIEYPILYLNEAPPPLDRKFTTRNFPHRYHWSRAIVSRLYELAAHFYRRNRLQFQAQGGVGIDDLNKAKDYQEMADKMWKEWTDWVQKLKVGINALGAIQSSGGSYYGWGD